MNERRSESLIGGTLTAGTKQIEIDRVPKNGTQNQNMAGGTYVRSPYRLGSKTEQNNTIVVSRYHDIISKIDRGPKLDNYCIILLT